MSEKPQKIRAGVQEDPLEQIITQGLDKIEAPEHATTVEIPTDEAPPTPKQEDSGENPPPASRKSRRSAVYLYLLILFGAAFMMLLLAYFIQQRSNEYTISSLRDSMNLSRKELLDQIRDLEEKNEALNEEIGLLNGELIQWQERYEEKDGKLTESWNLLNAMQEEIYCYRSFLQLEQYYQSGDLESCAAILILQMQGNTPYRTPYGAEERQEEIVKAVITAGILDEDYVLHPDAYQNLLDAYFDKISETIDSAQWAG